MVKRKQTYCALRECSAPTSKKGYCSEKCKDEASSTWVVLGGVGGSMFCGSSDGVNPYRWRLRESDARKFSKHEADKVAKIVHGAVARAGS